MIGKIGLKSNVLNFHPNKVGQFVSFFGRKKELSEDTFEKTNGSNQTKEKTEQKPNKKTIKQKIKKAQKKYPTLQDRMDDQARYSEGICRRRILYPEDKAFLDSITDVEERLGYLEIIIEDGRYILSDD